MKQAKRIGILMFLHSRDELSKEEEQELLAWRKKSPENEQLFLELSNPEYERQMMIDLYRGREIVFRNIKKRFPFLSDADLSDPDDPEWEKSRELFPEKDIADSGLSTVDFWANLLSEVNFREEEPIEENEEQMYAVKPDGKLAIQTKKPRRYIRIFRWAAAMLLAVTTLLFQGSRYGNYQALMISTDGQMIISQDFWRGFKAGLAGIKFGKTDKGEPIYIASNDRKAKTDKYFELITSQGGEFILQLPDGTRVWMNASSTIQYPANFDQDTIRLAVEGEAYIERSKNNSHHFLLYRSTVNRQASTVSVGPSSGININTYPDNGQMRVTLINAGQTDLPGDTEKGFRLLSGQQALFVRDSLVSTSNVNGEEIIAWKNGEFNYKETPLAIMIPALEKWYDVDIQYSSQIQDEKFSLHVSRSAPISDVLDSLKNQGLNINKSGKTINIWY
jgi:ferric-dicitrate binding protein FerR (iron transport regulator)